MTPRAVTLAAKDCTFGSVRYAVFQRALFDERIAAPVAEYRFHPRRRWRFDFAWPDQLVALEVEGGVWTRGRHTRGAGFLGDMAKYNAATIMGWRVLRCTPQTLCDPDTIQNVRHLLGARVEITVEAM